MKSDKQPPMRQGSPDDFQTPKEALDILIPYLNKDWKIWECASGKGNLVNALEQKGFDVLATDIIHGFDFVNHALAEDRKFKIDCIITNPPFSLKTEFIKRCFELNKPFALLLPLTTLESEKRQVFFRKHKIQLIIPNKRYNFETPSGKGSGSWFATAWFCYKMNLPNDLNFVEVKNEN